MIKIENLNFSYSRKEQLYNNLNFQADAGSIIGLLGKNGAGKSTLLKIMAGLLKPQKGKLEIISQTPFNKTPEYLSQVYLVPEEFSIEAVNIKVYIKSMAPLYPNFDYEKVLRILHEFELSEMQNLGKLSYGQKKKFIIAFALSTNCKVLFLDEPTNGLDIPSKALFRKVMASSISDDQLVIISTHQVKDIENIIDRIVLVDDGHVKYNHSIMSIMDSYAFTSTSQLNNDKHLYSESAPEGYRVIMQKNGTETPLDIELLFNALTNGTKLEIHE